MIDNRELIKPLLKFDNEHEFYFIQVLQRSKEIPGLGKNNNLIKAYFIYSLEQLDKQWNEMVLLATSTNSRIYIHLNRRNAQKLALEMMEDLAHCINSNQFALHKLYTSTCGRHHSEKDKTWIVDIDKLDIPDYTGFESYFEAIKQNIFSLDPVGDKGVSVIPTKNGIHFITKPFNSQKFKEIYSKIEIHRNNPTILYCV